MNINNFYRFEAHDDILIQTDSNYKSKVLKNITSFYDTSSINQFIKLISFKSDYPAPNLLSTGIKNEYFCQDILEYYIKDKKIDAEELLVLLIIESGALIPYDYLNKMAYFLFDNYTVRKKTIHSLREFYEKNLVKINFSKRSLNDYLTIVTDGVDHYFDFPNKNEMIGILDQCSNLFLLLNKLLLIERLLKLNRKIDNIISDLQKNSFSNNVCRKKIEADVNCPLIDGNDYIAVWDLIIYSNDDNGLHYTLAELLRVMMFDGFNSTADLTIRIKVVSFYRQVLKISSNAIIGLTSSSFYVEHGMISNPSYFYMGKNSILGKGTKIDCVGGFILCENSFIGGGMIPILIHTHKHITINGNNGVDERKNIKPVIFFGKKGTRIKMSESRLIEVADYLGIDHSEFDVYEVSK